MKKTKGNGPLRAELDLIESREIWVTEFTEEHAIKFHETIMERFEANPYKPITIHINSYGGEVDALFLMLDSMDSVRGMAPPEFKFLTVATGKACSAAAVLLSYGDYRFCTPTARIMVHQIISGTFGSQPANEAEFIESTRMNDRLLEILKKRCKLKKTLKQLKALLSHNVYLTPSQAQEYGIIDIIGYPKVIEKIVYDIRVLNSEKPKKDKR